MRAMRWLDNERRSADGHDARGEDGWAQLHVMDTGKGMSAEQLARLWEPHVSADRRHGYGLAIVKQTLDQVKAGSMWKSAPGAGRCSQFRCKAA
jgi:signal transduction histidine kinase